MSQSVLESKNKHNLNCLLSPQKIFSCTLKQKMFLELSSNGITFNESTASVNCCYVAQYMDFFNWLEDGLVPPK